jgi:hypothetical protein
MARAISSALLGLKVGRGPVELLGGGPAERGFTHRAWIAFQQGSHDDLVFTLEWPGVEPAEPRIPAQRVREAASRAVVLW